MALTMAQAYAYARQAGFDAAGAVFAVAIGMAESGLNPASYGDQDKQDGTWGPSVGLMQIRTLKADTGTGRDRDIMRLTDPVQNLAAAYHISNGGRNWSAWTVFTSGAYRQYVQQAVGASVLAGRTVPGATVTGDTGAVSDPAAVSTQPVSLASDWGAAFKDVGIWLLLAGFGATLVVAGAVHATGTGGVIRKVAGGAIKTGLKAAAL